MAEAAYGFFFAGTLLFFFWAYGVVSFVLDVKNKLLPLARQYLRGRRKLKEDQREEEERDERERQLL
jgi:hypothetical protein